MHRRRVVADQVYGRLTVLEDCRSAKNGDRFWLCVCECENMHTTRASTLLSGKTKSCGCRAIISNLKHGYYTDLATAAAYGCWSNMLKRCEEPSDKAYKYYGDRGITVCSRWHSFESFLEDMGPPPPRYTLERVRVNEGYEPSNCKWISKKYQNRNTRRNTLITICGEVVPIITACERFGIKPTTVYGYKHFASISSTEAFLWVLDRKLHGTHSNRRYYNASA